MENNTLFNDEFVINNREFLSFIFENLKDIFLIAFLGFMHIFVIYESFSRSPYDYLGIPYKFLGIRIKTNFLVYIIAFIILITFYVLFKIIMKTKMKKHPRSFEKTYLQITEEGIVISQKDLKRIVPWSYIRKIKKLRRIVLIYYSPYQSIVIPRRVINNENLKLITDRVNNTKIKVIKTLLVAIFITINITAFYLYREQTTLRYVFFDDNSIIERPFNSDKGFHYPYLLYIPQNSNSETYLIVRPNDANRKEYYYSDDLRDAKMMLKKWVATSSKYGVKCPVLVPIFPRPDEPEVNGLSNEDKYETFYIRNKEFYDRQESEDQKHQLLRMTDDAREYLLTRGLNTPKDKLVVSGATKWILGHLNLLRSFVIECQPDIKIEYIYDNAQSYSKFAVYVYNTMHKRK
jgi:hypothetical protein